jgi:hypothetical protein
MILIEQSASRPKASALASELGVADGFEVGEAVDDQQVGPSVREPAALRWRGWQTSGQTRVRRDPVGAARSFHRDRALYGHHQRRPKPRCSSYPMATVDLHYANPRAGMGFGTTSAGRSIPHPPWPDNRSLVSPQC